MVTASPTLDTFVFNTTEKANAMNILHTTRVFTKTELDKFNSILSHWTTTILKGGNFTFVKFGDGEIICMTKKGTGTNCDGHPYHIKLGEKLLEAWAYYASSDQNIYIGEWASNDNIRKFLDGLINQHKPKFTFTEFEILLQNTITTEKYNLLNTIKTSDRNKIFVGPKRLSEVQKFLCVDHIIEVPLIDSYSEYNNILEECKKLIVPGTIILYSAGMPTKVLVKDILVYNSEVTNIDFGSSFDAIFVGNTREGQPDPAVLKMLYKDLIGS